MRREAHYWRRKAGAFSSFSFEEAHMAFKYVRRALMVAALFAATGCGGNTVPSSMPANPQSLHGGAHAVSLDTSYVHTGVPYAIAKTIHRSRPVRVGETYPTESLLVFEGDSTNQQVAIYKHRGLKNNPAPIATITDGILCPYGMVLDKIGTLYVANNCGASTVTEYPKGQTTHTVTITNGISNPLGLAMDKSGTLYVSNFPASITEYPYGSTSPSVTITGSGLTDPFGLTLDKAGNLYVADFGASQVFEIAKGTTNVVPLNLQDLTEPLGVAIDKTTGNLWVTDGEGHRVNVYPPGSTTPSQMITTNYTFPYAISIDKYGGGVNSNISPPIAVYAYKHGQFTPYATLTNDVAQPTGLLIGQPVP
jgi:NHL repeat-containing protein